MNKPELRDVREKLYEIVKDVYKPCTDICGGCIIDINNYTDKILALFPQQEMMSETELGEFIRINCSKYLIEEAYAYSIANILFKKITNRQEYCSCEPKDVILCRSMECNLCHKCNKKILPQTLAGKIQKSKEEVKTEYCKCGNFSDLALTCLTCGKVTPKEPNPEVKKIDRLPFAEELRKLINIYSYENGSNTPDFILASYLKKCLITFNDIVNEREKYYGRQP